MDKQKILFIGGGAVLFCAIFFFGRTIPPKKKIPEMAAMQGMQRPKLTTEDVLTTAKKDLTQDESLNITELENSVVRGDVKAQQTKVYAQLSDFWKNKKNRPDISAYYKGQEGLLDNSEKELTFAAQMLLTGVMASDNDPAMQTWMATNAKMFFDKAIELNPNNDSSRIGLGACYMFGNISDNPMQGILPVREIAEKHPDNIFAQKILGYGGIKSGQYENAVKRFGNVLKIDPNNMEALLNLAETYDRMGDKTNAIKGYQALLPKINIPEAKKELQDRIKALQQ
ncbi:MULTISPECIES: tetratricopeptide repeat protein [Chitinophagaceae]